MPESKMLTTTQAAQQAEYTTADVAKMLACSDDTVRRLCERGVIPAHQLAPGGRWHIYVVDFDKYMAGRVKRRRSA